MDIAEQLREEAKRADEELQRRAPELKKQLARLEEQKALLEADLHSVQHAHQRCTSFQPSIDDTPQCPICWVGEGQHSALVPVPTANDHPNTDLFRCAVAGHEFTLFRQGP